MSDNRNSSPNEKLRFSISGENAHLLRQRVDFKPELKSFLQKILHGELLSWRGKHAKLVSVYEARASERPMSLHRFTSGPNLEVTEQVLVKGLVANTTATLNRNLAKMDCLKAH